MITYKLFRQRKDGTLGSLFINRKARLPEGVWLQANASDLLGCHYAYLKEKGLLNYQDPEE